ncbi:MAG: hypothetical protein ABUS51_10145 [Acidobacteriota bacterium]
MRVYRTAKPAALLVASEGSWPFAVSQVIEYEANGPCRADGSILRRH